MGTVLWVQMMGALPKQHKAASRYLKALNGGLER